MIRRMIQFIELVCLLYRSDQKNIMKEPYQRQVGDFEIRILPDGRVVFVAPDGELAEVAEALEQPDTTVIQVQENQNNVG